MRKDENKSSSPQKVQSTAQNPSHAPGYYPGTPYSGMELARAYVPIQRLGKLYTPAQALETGTLFPELYRPYPY